MAKKYSTTRSEKNGINKGMPQGRKSSAGVEKAESEKEQGVYAMSCAPKITQTTHLAQMLPIIIFGALSILIVRMHDYERPMDNFYWSGGSTDLTDFFSYYKMVIILICGVMALLILGYRLLTQSLLFKKSFVYIPIAIYSAFVIISYILCDYKEFALLGYNDRFEGTLPLLAYMVMLCLVINSVNSEKNVRWIIGAVGVSSALLGVLGVTQALDHDFFRTAIGQKIITPNYMTNGGQTFDQLVDAAAKNGEQVLKFTFQNREIYQTVYNINYVSFYLTLLLPLFGLLFIRLVMRGKAEPLWKKLVTGALFSLLLYNLIGSASSGGFFGMAIVVLVAFVVLNKKILKWWKPVAVLLLITVLVGGITASRWMPEITHTINGSLLASAQKDEVSEQEKSNAGAEITGDEAGEISEVFEGIDGVDGADGADGTDGVKTSRALEVNHKIDYFSTEGFHLIASIDGNVLDVFYNEEKDNFYVTDAEGTILNLQMGDAGVYEVLDDRFVGCHVSDAINSDGQRFMFFSVDRDENVWRFAITTDGMKYITDLGKLVPLSKVPSFGFEGRENFGSGRGYIWSRTIPMMKQTVLIGHGADTYCIYYPHNDYVGKFNSSSYRGNINIVVDKPHNMYFGAWIGTGGISVLALLVLYGYYIVTSFALYFRKSFEEMEYLEIAGVGIFLGICGFVVTGLVDDSTVSVMPMFYTLLGTGIAINMMLKRAEKND